MDLTFVISEERAKNGGARPPSLRHSMPPRWSGLLKWRHQISDLTAPSRRLFPGRGRGAVQYASKQARQPLASA
jgi:hypothetical protein